MGWSYFVDGPLKGQKLDRGVGAGALRFETLVDSPGTLGKLVCYDLIGYEGDDLWLYKFDPKGRPEYAIEEGIESQSDQFEHRD